MIAWHYHDDRDDTHRFKGRWTTRSLIGWSMPPTGRVRSLANLDSPLIFWELSRFGKMFRPFFSEFAGSDRRRWFRSALGTDDLIPV